MKRKAKRLKVSREAVALRPVRIDEKHDAFILYTGTTFPRDPYAGCELYLRRCHVFGYLTHDKSKTLIDVLNADGDIVQDFPITRNGFEYLRRTLKFRREQHAT